MSAYDGQCFFVVEVMKRLFVQRSGGNRHFSARCETYYSFRRCCGIFDMKPYNFSCFMATRSTMTRSTQRKNGAQHPTDASWKIRDPNFLFDSMTKVFSTDHKNFHTGTSLQCRDSSKFSCKGLSNDFTLIPTAFSRSGFDFVQEFS